MKIEKSTQSAPVGVVSIYRLTNASGASVSLCSFGATILSIVVPDKKGNLADVALGYAALKDYDKDGPCFGKTVGRVANRIARGKFTLNGREYNLPVNNGPNHLHGGPVGWGNRNWDACIVGSTIVFTLEDKSGEAGYPGNVKAEVVYSWSNGNELTVKYTATTDADTVVNMTNHSYFNLSGESAGSVMNHELKLYASRYLPTDDTLIPTGELAPVAGTPMDFISFKALGRDAAQDFPALKYGKGYDACWAIDDWKQGTLRKAAELKDPVSGRTLTVSTNAPGVQIYTGNWLAGSPEGKGGRGYKDNDGVAIECQAFPDSPNHPSFPSITLSPGEKYRSSIVFSFGK